MIKSIAVIQSINLALIVAFAFTSLASAQSTKEKLSFRVEGAEIEGALKRPTEIASDTKLPLVLLFGGFEEASKVLDLIRSPIPCVVASFDYPFDANRKLKFPESLTQVGNAKEAIHQTIVGIPLFLNKILEKGFIDPKKITIVGASFGAPFAIYAAAADERFRGVSIVQGFADVAGVIEHRLNMAFEDRYPSWIGSTLSLMLSRSLWLYANAPDVSESAKSLRKSQSVYFISAKDDSFIPKEASDLLWKSIQASKASSNASRAFTEGEHLQPGKPKLIEELLGMTLTWMKEKELL